jgi:hypothetical protein
MMKDCTTAAVQFGRVRYGDMVYTPNGECAQVDSIHREGGRVFLIADGKRYVAADCAKVEG